MAKEESEKEKRQRCKECGSSQVYIRIKEGSVVCRRCGNVDPIED